MDDHELDQARTAGISLDSAAVDMLATQLSNKDRRVRQQAVVALGKAGDRRAVEPLIFALSREFSYGASSYYLISDILDALVLLPDHGALDALVKLEAQLVDRNSPGCPVELPAGVITYVDSADSRLHRVVPRELHFKVLDVLRRVSVALNYRTEEIATRYRDYQDMIIQAEIDRTIPELARVLQEDASLAAGESAGAAEGRDDFSEGSELPSGDAMAGVDYNVLRREMEIEVAEYLRDNDKLQGLIREGQRIKAHIGHAKRDKRKYEAAVPDLERATE